MNGFVLPTPRQRVIQSNAPASKPEAQTTPPAPSIRRALASAAAGGLTSQAANESASGSHESSALGANLQRLPLSSVLASLAKRREGPPTSASLPASRAAVVSVATSNSAPPSPTPLPGASQATVNAPDPNDWVAQSAAAQRSLAELGQKAALDTALLKLQNDLNDATVSLMKSMGSSVKSAAQ